LTQGHRPIAQIFGHAEGGTGGFPVAVGQRALLTAFSEMSGVPMPDPEEGGSTVKDYLTRFGLELFKRNFFGQARMLRQHGEPKATFVESKGRRKGVL